MKYLPYFLIVLVCGLVWFFFFRQPAPQTVATPPPAVAEATPPPTEQYDLLIRNARITDGSGSPLALGSIAVRSGRIALLGLVPDDAKATAVIDAKGAVAAPGFIDVHTHSENVPKIRDAENFIRMGVTTIVSGNCGSSSTDLEKFFTDVKNAPCAVNVASLIGHNSVRIKAMHGIYDRMPSPEELQEMKALVEKGMKDGAVGFSTGLIYPPGSYTKPEEIIELAKVASASGGIYASHMRFENVKIFDALDELFRIAREAHIPAEVSHLKLSGPSAWGQANEVLARLDKARAEGLLISQDAYAYTASSTTLSQLIPDKAREGTRDDFKARVADPAKKAEIIAGMQEMRERQGQADYTYAVIARFTPDPSLNGKTIPQAAKIKRGSDSIADQVELILDIYLQGSGSGVFHGMSEPDLQTFLRHPATMVASDGGPRSRGGTGDATHPRSYGNNARVLGRYVREQKILPLEEAIRRMTSMPARTFKLKDRGSLLPGSFADIAVFDPDKVSDPSTYDSPHHFAEGFIHVIVNGGIVLQDGALTGTRSGGPLRNSTSTP